MASPPPDNPAATLWTLGRIMTHPLHTEVAAFFEERRQEIYAYLLTLGIRPDEAQEHTNESFLRYYAALRSGTSIQNPRAWVYAVAHNLAMTRHAETDAATLPFDLPAITTQTPETLALEQERLTLLHRAIENLSPQQRHCLHLRADGLRYREIAAIIGINPSTVGELLHRAVKRLRKALYE